MAEPILEVTNLKTGFYSKQGFYNAVEDVSFSVYPGKTLGIVGESGCGKSVTCMSMLKLLPEKSARVDGGSSGKGPDKAFRKGDPPDPGKPDCHDLPGFHDRIKSGDDHRQANGGALYGTPGAIPSAG